MNIHLLPSSVSTVAALLKLLLVVLHTTARKYSPDIFIKILFLTNALENSMRKVRFLPGLSGKPFGYILHLFFQLLQKEDQSVFKFYLDVEPLGSQHT